MGWRNRERRQTLTGWEIELEAARWADLDADAEDVSGRDDRRDADFEIRCSGKRHYDSESSTAIERPLLGRSGLRMADLSVFSFRRARPSRVGRWNTVESCPSVMGRRNPMIRLGPDSPRRERIDQSLVPTTLADRNDLPDRKERKRRARSNEMYGLLRERKLMGRLEREVREIGRVVVMKASEIGGLNVASALHLLAATRPIVISINGLTCSE